MIDVNWTMVKENVIRRFFILFLDSFQAKKKNEIINSIKIEKWEEGQKDFWFFLIKAWFAGEENKFCYENVKETTEIYKI